VLAELDGRVITLRDFDERLSRQPLALRMQYRSADARRRLLDDMVRLEVLADEARRRGIDRLPEIRDRISELLAEELTSEVFATDTTTGDVTDAEVKAYYDAHAAEFHTPEVRELKDVAVLIRQRLRAERRTRAVADFVNGLRARAHAIVHAERLGAATAPAAAPSTSAARTD
jgi:peptidyl-prolyl cis-trans isomerase C